MAFNRTFLAFVVFATLAVSLAVASDPETALISAESMDREQAVRMPFYDAKHCYRKYKTCCYKYHTCGQKCKIVSCEPKRVCLQERHGSCIKHKRVYVCKLKCYNKYCPKITCTKYTYKKEPSYKEPKEYFGKKPMYKYKNEDKKPKF